MSEDVDLPTNVRVVERRRAPRKPVSETVADMREGRRGLGKRARTTVTVEDLSEDGARLIAPTKDELTIGSTIEIEFEQKVGKVTVRNISADPLQPGSTVYGVEIGPDQEALREAIRSRLDREETTMEWIWAHTGPIDQNVQHLARRDA